jgi:NADH-quinone oxidoreductase subunit F
VYGVATFYALFSVEARPPRVLHVCNDLACRCAGSDKLIAALTEQIGPQGTDHDGTTWHASPCLGQCDRAPAAFLVESGETPTERELTGVDAGGLLEIMNRATPSAPRSATPP